MTDEPTADAIALQALNTARAALSAVAALYIELVQGGTMAPRDAALAISRAAAVWVDFPPVTDLLDGLAKEVSQRGGPTASKS